MSATRRTLTALAAAVVAVLTGSTPAFAGPAPLIEPEPAPAGSTGSAGSQLFDGLLPVLLVVVALVVVAAAGAATVRIQQHRHVASAT